MARMSDIQSARGAPTGGSLCPRRSRTSSRLADPPRILFRPGHRPRRGSARSRRRGSGGGAPPSLPLLRRAGNAGVRGGTAPRQPPQGTHGVWPQGVSWLVSHNHADSRVICTTGSRGRPGLLSAAGAEQRAGSSGGHGGPSPDAGDLASIRLASGWIALVELAVAAHAVAVAPDVDDMAAVKQPVQQRGGHDLVAEDVANGRSCRRARE